LGRCVNPEFARITGKKGAMDIVGSGFSGCRSYYLDHCGAEKILKARLSLRREFINNRKPSLNP
jgi:hypothetical protein